MNRFNQIIFLGNIGENNLPYNEINSRVNLIVDTYAKFNNSPIEILASESDLLQIKNVLNSKMNISNFIFEKYDKTKVKGLPVFIVNSKKSYEELINVKIGFGLSFIDNNLVFAMPSFLKEKFSKA